MDPLQEWSCKGADITSPAEYEAALCQLEEYSPDICPYNDNIREERWTYFSLEGVKFPAATVDVIQWGEALAVFERDLIIHFQQISKAAALCARALLGGVKRSLEVYRRVDNTTKAFPWSHPTTKEKCHTHAEGVLMVALTNLNVPPEAWRSARLLRAIRNANSKLQTSSHVGLPFAQPCIEHRRSWSYDIPANTTCCKTICITSNIWLAELEVCRQKASSDRWTTAHCEPATSIVCQDS